MKLGRKTPDVELGKRVDEFHRPPTRFERLRVWLERLPKVRLFVVLTAITWLALTALIGIGAQTQLERSIAQGIIERGDVAYAINPLMALFGVGLVVATEMGIAWYSWSVSGAGC